MPDNKRPRTPDNDDTNELKTQIVNLNRALVDTQSALDVAKNRVEEAGDVITTQAAENEQLTHEKQELQQELERVELRNSLDRIALARATAQSEMMFARVASLKQQSSEADAKHRSNTKKTNETAMQLALECRGLVTQVTTVLKNVSGLNNVSCVSETM
jgi:chromosome segregation ATPase